MPLLRPLILLCALALSAGATDWPALQESRWEKAQIRPERLIAVQLLAQRIERNRGRYDVVAGRTGVPWNIVAALHQMECGGSFRQHLHNGDPLTARTRQVPAGRPKTGVPPFAWDVSAEDALRYDHLDRADWSRIGTTLQTIEGYNGTGYQRFHPDTPTPYLWSWTTLYTRGKYVADGKWDPWAVSQQCGAAAILRAASK